MNILAVSDRVMDRLYCGQARQYYPDVDLLVGCGDLPFYYLDFLTSAFNVPLFYVRGNHDGGPQYSADGHVWSEVRGGADIHGKVVMHKDLILAGFQGSMRYKAHADYMYSESEMRMTVAQIVPRLLWNRRRLGRALDILVTHSPPYGIQDRPDLAHTGFKVFLSFLRMFKPRYHLHGHIHVYRQDETVVTRYEKTEVINVYPYRLLEID
ncbi:MAG: metallophosphoesterase [Candidatus Promineofilum sp.]|nr:metallophosphoesterase [Promineifilum sp.]MBP9657117.1 metallophosphoesterase [Promineifilum sp.]